MGSPPAEPGTYYQGWVKGPEGLVTVGTFHLRGGDDTIDLWSGVPLDRYPTLTVTLQDEGGGHRVVGSCRAERRCRRLVAAPAMGPTLDFEHARSPTVPARRPHQEARS